MNAALIHAGIVAALTPPRVRITSSRFSHDGFVLHIVSVDGDFYYAEPLEVDWLRRGHTPQDLELVSAGDTFPEDES